MPDQEIISSPEQEQEPQTPPATPTNERLFSQGDVDRIVQRRLADERARSAQQLQLKEQELALTRRRYAAQQSLAQRGMPETLLDLISFEDEQTFEQLLDQLGALIDARAQQLSENQIAQRLKAGAGAPQAGTAHRAAADIKRAMGLTR